LKEFAEQVHRVFRVYAQQNGWADADFRLFLHFNEEWNTAHIIVLSEKFKEGKSIDHWRKIMMFLNKNLQNSLFTYTTINLSLRTESQVSEGAIYEFGPEFVPIEEILAARPVA
jgi:hypothetical protein